MRRNLDDKKFKKLLKEFTPKTLINKHIKSEITLSSKQLDEVIRRKNESNSRIYM